MNCKNKLFMNKKKAFTLIELLIVIAIIGILFVVLVSKVDFATDKAKTTGVQTDFRSFQMAFETVSRENAGFNTFGYNTGDNAGGVTTAGGSITLNGKAYTYTNALKDLGDGKRNSYDEGDTNLDGIQNGSEIWTGHKIYTETFTKEYSLKKPGATMYDANVIAKLESAINANLDPSLHITIGIDGYISMANGAKDPWGMEYHGAYTTGDDGSDRGVLIMYSNGPNQKFRTNHSVSGGIVVFSVPDGDINGKDDCSMAVIYTLANGYGETKTSTAGFSNNLKPIVKPNDTPIENQPDEEGSGQNGGVRPGNPDPETPVEPNEPENEPGIITNNNMTFTNANDVTIKCKNVGNIMDIFCNGRYISYESTYRYEDSYSIKLSSKNVYELGNGTHTFSLRFSNGETLTGTFTFNLGSLVVNDGIVYSNRNDISVSIYGLSNMSEMIIISLDGMTIERSQYNITDYYNYATIKFKDSILAGLSNGLHTVKVQYGINRQTVSATFNLQINPGVPSRMSLNSYSWDEIRRLAQSDLTQYDFERTYHISLGSQKMITIPRIVAGVQVGTEDVMATLVDYDHQSGGFVFMFDSGLDVKMNDDGILGWANTNNIGGYTASDAREEVSKFYDKLSGEISSYIKYVEIASNNSNIDYSMTSYMSAKLFIPSFVELGGNINNVMQPYGQYLEREGEIFDYFKNNGTRQSMSDGMYLTRSSDARSDNFIYVVDEYGNIVSTDCTTKASLVLAFVIG